MFLEPRPHVVGAVEDLAHQEARAIGVLVEEGDRLPDDGLEAILAAGRRHQELGQHIVPALEQPIEHREAQVVLAREVIEQRRLADPDDVGDVLQRGAVEALGSKQRGRCFEKLGAYVHGGKWSSGVGPLPIRARVPTGRVGYPYHSVGTCQPDR